MNKAKIEAKELVKQFSGSKFYALICVDKIIEDVINADILYKKEPSIEQVEFLEDHTIRLYKHYQELKQEIKKQ